MTDNQILTCFLCGKQDETVNNRACGYYEDVHNDPTHMEIICDACENEHLMDI